MILRFSKSAINAKLSQSRYNTFYNVTPRIFEARNRVVYIPNSLPICYTINRSFSTRVCAHVNGCTHQKPAKSNPASPSTYFLRTTASLPSSPQSVNSFTLPGSPCCVASDYCVTSNILANDSSTGSNNNNNNGQNNSSQSGVNNANSNSNHSGNNSSNSNGSGSSSRRRKSQADRSLTKPTIPEFYPQVMAIPIAKRPLFPGFYKAITIRNPDVTAAIFEMIKRGQPYIGAFLLKDENTDQDVIETVNDVHEVGSFCQITSAFDIKGDRPSLTAVLYPHRRIKMTGLVPPNRNAKESMGRATVEIINDETTTAPEFPETPSKPGVNATGNVNTDADDTLEAGPASTKSGTSSKYGINNFLRDYKVSLVNVDNLTEDVADTNSPTIRALVSEIVSVFREIAQLNTHYREQISNFAVSHGPGNVADDPAKLADFAAAVSFGESCELQDVLETLSLEERLHKALLLVKKELMNAQLQSKISKDVESKIQKRQREYWLMEQLKGIKRELGIESDGKDKLIENFRAKAANLTMPGAVQKIFDEELNKLQYLEPAASEFNVTRNYLDWLTQIPWGIHSAENFDVNKAKQILDEDHYGLESVKDQILEFIAIGRLRGTVEGKILCMVGPPGVGKTSVGKSIARALNRQYYRFSVGGLTDVAEIKGHRRTYVGALPGRVIQALKRCQTENPLILIDEIDKIGRGHWGDPASALLELLDPEQNNSFLDHYMDVPVNLSKVLFVCTANMTDTIPRPLLDRMEIIELSGYVTDEKLAIAERYLIPQAKELCGLKDVDVTVDSAAVQELIDHYCRESGMRNLKKKIEQIFRKSALKIVQQMNIEDCAETKSSDQANTCENTLVSDANSEGSAKMNDDNMKDKLEQKTSEDNQVKVAKKTLKVPETAKVIVNAEILKDYVGPPLFTSGRLYETAPPGVVMGLAWTENGGTALYVESIVEQVLSSLGKPSLERTGNMKTVMKESVRIAYSYAKHVLASRFPENHFFDHAKIHLHCPQGAVPKDGPSAGITMTSSLLSLALKAPLDPSIAMTGELTVTGKVLRIGGLREKTVAARRANARTIIFPQDNWSTWLELPENIKKGIEGKPVSWYDEVFDIIFADLNHERANNAWKAELEASTSASTSNEST